MNWIPLTSNAQLTEIDSLSQTQPVLLFKHSTRCSISAAALNRLERKWDDMKTGGAPVFFLDLIANRNISNEVATHYGIQHESPQVLIIVNGKCAYDNSHLGISFDDIAETISELSPA